MKNTLIGAALILAALATPLDAATWKCRETGKTLNKCCCEMKDGKFTCRLTKQTYDKCCCDTNARSASIDGFQTPGLPEAVMCGYV